MTDPVGLPFRLTPETVAVRVVGLPAATVVGEAETVVVELTVVTVSAAVVEAVAAMVAPAVVPEPEIVSVDVPEVCRTGRTVTVTCAVPPAATVAAPPVQVAMLVRDDAQLTVTVPAKPFTEVIVTEVVFPVVALPATLTDVGEADSV